MQCNAFLRCESRATLVKLFLRALCAFLALPVVVAGVVPYLILGDTMILSPTAVLGGCLLGIGLGLLIWCVRDFFVSGRGTLAPWDPPKHLVVSGLYRFVRNPMYVAVLLIIAGWCALFISPPLVLYLFVLAIGFHLRVVLHEEPWLRKTFGAEWEAYSRNVSRWLPR